MRNLLEVEYEKIFSPKTMAGLKGKSGESLKQMIGNKDLMQTLMKSKAVLDEIIDAEEFIGVKSYKARGKRLTTFDVKKIVEIEPLQKEEPDIEDADIEDIEIEEVEEDLDDAKTAPPKSPGEQMSLGFD